MADGTTNERIKAEGVPDATNEEKPSTAPPITQLPPLLSVLEPSDVAQPVLPTKEEMENVLLALRKRALLEEYLGDAKA